MTETSEFTNRRSPAYPHLVSPPLVQAVDAHPVLCSLPRKRCRQARPDGAAVCAVLRREKVQELAFELAAVDTCCANRPEEDLLLGICGDDSGGGEKKGGDRRGFHCVSWRYR